MKNRLLLTVSAFAVLCSVAMPAWADNAQDAADMADFFRAARAVISKNQDKINDAALGDKGLSAAVVLATAKENYKTATGKDLDESSVFLKAEIAAVESVMNENQALINESGKGFKGFLPAVFGAQVAKKTTEALAGKAVIKLTAPNDMVRNRKNRPDAWEDKVIEGTFKAPGAEKGKAFSEMTTVDGKNAYRLILPEYYIESCMGCHGEPKGATDISGGKKEGKKVGDLGGAISVTVY